MTSIVIAMVITLVLVLAIAGLVVVGIEGRGRRRAPQIARRVTRAAQHLNGEGQPPARFVRFIEHALSRVSFHRGHAGI